MNWKKQIKTDCAARLEQDTPKIAAYEAIPFTPTPTRKMRFVLPLSASCGLVAVAVVLFVTLRSTNSHSPSGNQGDLTASTTHSTATSTPGSTEATGDKSGAPTSVYSSPNYAFQVGGRGALKCRNVKGETLDFQSVSLKGTTLSLEGTIALSHSLVTADYSLHFELWAGEQWNLATLAKRNSELAALESHGIANPKAESYSLDLLESSSEAPSFFVDSFQGYSGAIHWAYEVNSNLVAALRSGSYPDLTLGFLSPVTSDDPSQTYYYAFSFSQVTML